MQVAIVGAGICGLATAIFLNQAGVEVSIYERHSSRQDIGAGIVCWPNASFVLEQLGILEQVQRVGGMPKRMKRISSDGESLGHLEIQDIDRIMGYDSISVYRRDLMEILESQLNSLGVQVTYNKAVSNIVNAHPGMTQLKFEDGTSVSSDIILGADGRMASIVRQYVLGDNTPEYQGFANWIATYESETPLFTDMDILDYWGVGQRFGIVPIDTYRCYWAAGQAAAISSSESGSDIRTFLIETFKEWPAPITQIIQETPVPRIRKINVHDHDPTQTWYRNNVLMMGDAAHAPLPTSGQGACQALEDAWYFSKILQETNFTIEDTFERFTKTRLAKTTGIIETGRHLAKSIFNTDENYCKMRNASSKATDFKALAKGMAAGWSQGLLPSS